MKKKPKASRTGRGAVLAIAALLFASSALRVATGMGAAFASDGPTSDPLTEARSGQPDTTVSVREADTKVAQNTGQAARPPSLDRNEMASLLVALKMREARAQEREKQIDMRTKALAVADQEIQKRLTSLADAEKSLRATLAMASTAAEDDLTNLTAVYENMKPKDAAALFEQMDPNFAAGFLGRMRPDVAAAVMAGLSPDKAYSVSVILAGRNAEVPKT